MTIVQLIYFSEVYRQCSITSASKNLHISQQSLSTSIQELEKEFSTSFFIRSHKGVTPTVAGERFYQSAQRILQELAILRQDLDAAHPIDHCRISLCSSLAITITSPLYTLLTQTFPNTFFDFSTMPYNKFISLSEQEYPHIIFTLLLKDSEGKILDADLPTNYHLKYISRAPKTLHMWVSARSPLAKYNVLTPTHLKNAALCFPKYQTEPSTVLKVLNCAHIYPDQQYYAETEDIFISLLKSGNYITSDLCTENRPLIHPNLLKEPDLMLKPLSNNFLKIHLVLLYHEDYEQFYPIIADYLCQVF